MKRFSIFTAVGVAGSLAISNMLKAQVGNDNPTGVTGQFSGNSMTGCSYSPYTGNATRTIVDITVTGAVGKYPLQWSRTLNTRLGYSYFGAGGGWLHSYVWSVTPHPDMVNGLITPTSYDVTYPDGRSITFVPSTKGDTCYMGPAGVADRLQTVNGSGDGYVIFPDGGKLKFHQSAIQDPETHWYDYSDKPIAILDPSGLTTTITLDANLNVTQVTEPAGRWLKVTYASGRLSQVDAGYGTGAGTITQTVKYFYSSHGYPSSAYTMLDSVQYTSDPGSPSATYTYQASNIGSGAPLIQTCNDLHYPGPMKRIGYTFQTGGSAVYGQIASENYYNGSFVVNATPTPTPAATPVATLTVTGTSTRMETRGDGSPHPTRTWSYGTSSAHGGFSVLKPYLLGDFTDFKANHTYLGYDTNFYLNNVQDANNHITSFLRVPYTGNVNKIIYPDPSPSPFPNKQYFYSDTNTGYYLDHVVDELGHTAVQYTRDTNMRKTQITYADTGLETFTYNSFGEVLTHLNTSGGTEIYSYDSRGLKQTYADAYHTTVSPSFRYQYDSRDRISGITDALGASAGDINHTTSFTYDNPGRLLTTTYPVDPFDSQRHTVTNEYFPEDALKSVTDQLGHKTSFVYDDYKRLKTKTTPARDASDTTHTTSFFYDGAGTADDYTHADSNVTYVKSPSGRVIAHNRYDENFRKASATVAEDYPSELAKTVYAYDNVGNLASVQSPEEQAGHPGFTHTTQYFYDSRDRLQTVTDADNKTTTYKYDAANRKTEIDRANGQVITYESYDNMNRPLRIRATQTPNADAVTKYTYYTSGLGKDFQDPLISSGTNKCTYSYDLMGRKTGLTYPAATPGASPGSESWHYDGAGRNDKYTNRNGKEKSINYDALNRVMSYSWNDVPQTPGISLIGYDGASRITAINNPNANISRVYYDDNSIKSETTQYPGADNVARTVTSNYDADGNLASLQYPASAYSFTYDYTHRNQVLDIKIGGNAVITYDYDRNGNLKTRTPNNSTNSTYVYDELDRLTNITHNLANGADVRTFRYGYDSVGNRMFGQRENGNGDVFGYDKADQANGFILDTPIPATPSTPTPAPKNIDYDANGNRSAFAGVPYGAANNLNQYTTRNGSSQSQYDVNGNLIAAGWDSTGTYSYDAKNRLTQVVKNSTTHTFKYDGLNRQISYNNGLTTTYYVYDGWSLLAEYTAGSSTPSQAYLFGAGGLVKKLAGTTYYYYQDGSGSTSHITNSSGTLQEWYRYDLHGTPIASSGSSPLVRHLFTGQQWNKDLALYDLRNRFYSPDHGRFLQADPIGFGGDPAHLYRYCGNNPATGVDPSGLNFWLSTEGNMKFTLPQPTYTFTEYFNVTAPAEGSGVLRVAIDSTSTKGRYVGSLPPVPQLLPRSGPQAITTPVQDLILRQAIFDGGSLADIFGSIIRDNKAIFGADPYTGNIFNSQWNWVGWENPYTGNLYDSQGDWADWDPNYKKTFAGSGYGYGGQGGAPAGFTFAGMGALGYGGPISFTAANGYGVPGYVYDEGSLIPIPLKTDE